MERQEAFEIIGRHLRNQDLGMYEIYYLFSRGTSIESKHQQVDSFETYENEGLSLRIFNNGKMGFSYHFGIDNAACAQIVEDAIADMQGITEDPCFKLPEIRRFPFPELSIFDSKLDEVSTSKKIETAIQIENYAIHSDSRIKRVRKACLNESVSHIVIYNSQDVLMEFKRTNLSCSIEVVADDGRDSQVGSEYCFTPFFDELRPEEIGLHAAQKALEMLGARRIFSTKCPVILNNFAATQFLGIFISSFSGERVLKGKSVLGDKLGKSIFTPLLTIIDDGCYQKGAGSAPFDGEGMPSQQTVLVENGIVSNFLYDTYWGKRSGMSSTGNACRLGLRAPPTVGFRNIYIKTGKNSASDLLRQVTRGLLITYVMGIHTADPISGDFSVGISGCWIESGEKKYPVNGVVLTGNLIDLFSNIKVIADDLRFFGPVGSPSLLIENMDISGI